MSTERERRELAVLIVSYRRADLLERALASVDKWLPEAPVHVWDNASSGSPQVRELAAKRPDITWTFSEFNLGYIAAMNRLMAQVPDATSCSSTPTPSSSARSPGPARRSPSPASPPCRPP